MPIAHLRLLLLLLIRLNRLHLVGQLKAVTLDFQPIRTVGGLDRRRGDRLGDADESARLLLLRQAGKE